MDALLAAHREEEQYYRRYNLHERISTYLDRCSEAGELAYTPTGDFRRDVLHRLTCLIRRKWQTWLEPNQTADEAAADYLESCCVLCSA